VRRAALVLVGAVVLLALPATAQAASLRLALIAHGLPNPIYVTTPPNDGSRVFIVLKGGVIRVMQNGKLLPRPFLNISNRVSHGAEQGLLSMAFDPNYGTNHRFFVSYTNRAGDSRVTAYHAISPTRANPFTMRIFLSVNQPAPNHNGGDIAFGPDGRLYVGLGDGGGEGDPRNLALNPRSRFGKILRMDVSRFPAPTQIYALGLRNPWRFSFDRANGDLYIGDVGQNRFEEIDRIPGGTPAGVSLGWSYYEGFAVYKRQRMDRRPRFPMRAYPHNPGGNCAVTGGYVYRGMIPALRGAYIYADFCSGTVWHQKPGGRPGQTAFSRKVHLISSFGQGAGGGLFMTSLNGSVYRIISVS
jgi:glucose/arabinose dehydrogenase